MEAQNAFFFPYQTQITFWILGGKNILFDGGGILDGAGQVWSLSSSFFFLGP
jgi:galacturan 1,4-alpha-galacturonidase